MEPNVLLLANAAYRTHTEAHDLKQFNAQFQRTIEDFQIRYNNFKNTYNKGYEDETAYALARLSLCMGYIEAMYHIARTMEIFDRVNPLAYISAYESAHRRFADIMHETYGDWT